jgi:iron(III) transport system ATP-binding protein
VLLLDEPFSSLDANQRTVVREEVHGLLRAQGATTVLVTHDQEEALSLADSVAVLREGRIVQHGAPSELYEAPVDRQLASFLGAVNVIDAEFEGATARTALGALALRMPDAAPHASATDRGGLVMIRPEQLEVSPRQAPGAGEPAAGIAGHVEQCRYYGHDALLRIRCESADLEVLVARVHGEQALPVGAPVTVAARGPVSAL